MLTTPSLLALMVCLGPPKPPRLQPLLPWAWEGGRGQAQGLSGQQAEKGKKKPHESKRSLEILSSGFAIHGQLWSQHRRRAAVVGHSPRAAAAPAPGPAGPGCVPRSCREDGFPSCSCSPTSCPRGLSSERALPQLTDCWEGIS